MKKLTVFLLCMALALTLAACSGGNNARTPGGDNSAPTNSGESNPPTDPTTQTDPTGPAGPTEPSYQTVDEIINAVGGLNEYSIDENGFIALFEQDGVTYRVEAASNAAAFQQILDLEFSDPDYDAKARAVFGPLTVTDIENLTAGLPSAAELAAYVGKTGQDLIDAGFTLGNGYFDDETVYYLYNGYYQFRVVFNETVEYREDMDEYATLLPLTVKSVTFEGYHS